MMMKEKERGEARVSEARANGTSCACAVKRMNDSRFDRKRSSSLACSAAAAAAAVRSAVWQFGGVQFMGVERPLCAVYGPNV